MNWLFLISISVFLASASSLIQRALLKREQSDPVIFSIVFQATTGLIIAAVGLLKSRFFLPALTPQIVFGLGLMTVTYGAGNIFIFKSLKIIQASKFIILFSIRGAVTVLIASLLFNEVLNPVQLSGGMLILAGIALSTLKSIRIEFQTGDLYAIFAAICFGLANINDRVLLKSFDVFPYVSLAFLIPAIVVAIFTPKTLSRLTAFKHKDSFKRMLILCIIYAISAITFFYALQIAPNTSQLATINLTTVVLTVILSAIFLKEREGLARKITASLITFWGLILIS